MRFTALSMDTTLLKGFAVFEALAKSDRPRGVTELSAELGLVKSRTHSLLQTLQKIGYVRKDEIAGRYECTLRMWEMGSAVMDRFDLRPAARPCLEWLARKTDESVHLSILDGIETLYVDKIDSAQPVRAYSRIAGRAPAYCVATGKALLAYAPASTVELACKALKKHTANTITEQQAFQRELGRIRETGYAINRGEWRESVVGLAVPILDLRRVAIAAIGISGPVERLSTNRLKELAPLVVRAGRSTTRALGLDR